MTGGAATLAPVQVVQEVPAPVATEAARRPKRRWVRRIAIGLVVVVTALVCSGAVLWVATPSVGDAKARAAAILRAHGGISDAGNPPSRVSQALIATEDRRFYSDYGLDPKSLARGALSFVRGGALQGATLNAQLAKLLYLDGHRGVFATLEEATLAVKLDASYSKREILAMYLDAAYFGHGAYGIVAAARTYFGLPADQLSWAQASMLAGLVNAPTAYDPTAHLHLARSRQHHVLDRLVAVKALTKAQAAAIFAQPLHPAIAFSG